MGGWSDFSRADWAFLHGQALGLGQNCSTQDNAGVTAASHNAEIQMAEHSIAYQPAAAASCERRTDHMHSHNPLPTSLRH